jgi:hypothetical protein
MRRLLFLILLIIGLGAAPSADAAKGKVIKVLPHLLDLKGRHSLSPSLYARDAYQAQLRQHPEQRSGVRFDIHWKTRGAVYSPLKLRVELRGTTKGDLPSRTVLLSEVKPGGWFGRWTSLPLTGEDYQKLGEVTAWRVTLWEGDKMLGEQKSFMW